MTLISWFLDCINNYKYYKKFELIYIIIIINECNKNYIYIYKLIFKIKISLNMKLFFYKYIDYLILLI